MPSMDAVGWDVVADRIRPKNQDVSSHIRRGATSATVVFGARRYVPQVLRVVSIETNSAAADTQISNAEAQIKTNTTWTDQFGATHTVTVMDFVGEKTAQIDGTYRVDGIYKIIKYEV